MRAAPLLLLAALPACSLQAGEREGDGVRPSGGGTSRSYPVSGFSKIDLAGADNVIVSVGGGFAVRADGPADQLDKLRIIKDGDTLGIGRKHDSLGWTSHPAVTVHVTLPALSEASLSGSGDMHVDRVTGGSFSADAAGSGNLSLDQLAVDDAAFSIAGSGTINAAGTAKALHIDIAGSGKLHASKLTASAAKVNIAGSGDAAATVNGDAEVSMLGSGDVDLGSGARCKVDKLGSGTAHYGR